jgi:hypothetical protein
MAIVHQELDAVLFGRDGILGGDLHHLQIAHADLEAAGNARRALVGAD